MLEAFFRDRHRKDLPLLIFLRFLDDGTDPHRSPMARSLWLAWLIRFTNRTPPIVPIATLSAGRSQEPLLGRPGERGPEDYWKFLHTLSAALPPQVRTSVMGCTTKVQQIRGP
jgi:hypothetical protein